MYVLQFEVISLSAESLLAFNGNTHRDTLAKSQVSRCTGPVPTREAGGPISLLSLRSSGPMQARSLWKVWRRSRPQQEWRPQSFDFGRTRNHRHSNRPWGSRARGAGPVNLLPLLWAL